MRKSLAIFGFSLIELMIVITIISLLSAIAIPSYKTYIQRARFAEIIAIANVYKTAVSIALQEGQALDTIKTGEAGIPDAPAATKNLASLTVDKGIITATGTDLVEGATYILTPDINGDWSISGSCLKAGLCAEV